MRNLFLVFSALLLFCLACSATADQRETVIDSHIRSNKGMHAAFSVEQRPEPARRDSDHAALSAPGWATPLPYVELVAGLLIVLVACVTSIVRLKRRLRNVQAKLEQGIKERTITLEQSNQQLQQQILERQQMEQMLHAVAEQISANTGTAFFNALCEKMAQTLDVNYVLIGRINASRHHTIDTVAVFDTHQLIDNFSYSVHGTPCAEVLNEGRNLYSQNLQQHFPDNARLRERGWDSYAAIPLRTVDKDIIGILVIMDTKPIKHPQTTLTILQTFAYRISAELMRIKTEADLKLLATTFETHEAIAILDPQMRYIRVNQAFCDITGYASDEIIGKANSILWDDHHGDNAYQDIYQHLLTQGYWHGELSRKRKDGSTFLQWGGMTAVHEGGDTSHYVEAFLDFTQQKQQQQRLEQLAAEEQSLGQLLRISLKPSSFSDYLNEVLDCLLVAVPWLNLLKKGAVFLINKEDQSLHLTASRGFSEEHIKTCRQVALGSCLCGKAALDNKILYHDHTTNCLEQYYDENIPHGHYMIPFSQKQKVIGVLTLHLNADHPYSKREEQFLYRVADIISMGANRRSYEEHIEFLAYHDLLTDLPNRRLLLDRLEQEQAISQRIGTIGAVLSVDLDRFKNTNDALGHTIGDQVLQETARRLELATCTGDTVTRLSSDEFVIFLPALSTDIDEASIKAQDVAEVILDKISQPFQLAGHDFSLTASIGIALFTSEVGSPTELLQFSDAAMHHAKAEGGNNFQFFHPTMQSKAELRLVLERELNKAIDNNELQLFCQPQVDHLGRIRGAEFLVRWQHPEKGLISPGQFIPVAEETGQIRAIDAWVLQTACSNYCRWQQQNQLTELESISINISPQLFHQGNFVAMVKQILDQTRMPADKLILELTEGILIKDIEGAIQKMDLLHRQGIRFSIDDFGTGYSSMSYLKRLSIDELKIDQSFIRDLTASRLDAAIVDTIITLAKQLNLSLVAEGVETQSQRDLLHIKGCQIFQGYYFSKPMPVAELPAYQPATASQHNKPPHHRTE